MSLDKVSELVTYGVEYDGKNYTVIKDHDYNTDSTEWEVFDPELGENIDGEKAESIVRYVLETEVD